MCNLSLPLGSRSHQNSWRSHSSSTRIHTPQGSEQPIVIGKYIDQKIEKKIEREKT